MFGKKKEVRKLSFDRNEKMPVIRCSICNGEQVGGLKDIKSGAFEEIMLIRGSRDLEIFSQMVGEKDIRKEY